VNVSTGALEALTAQVAELAERVREIAAREFAEQVFFEAGFAAGQDSIRRSVGVPVRSRAERPARAARGHLRPVLEDRR
jgi:hypothetical protein